MTRLREKANILFSFLPFISHRAGRLFAFLNRISKRSLQKKKLFACNNPSDQVPPYKALPEFGVSTSPARLKLQAMFCDSVP